MNKRKVFRLLLSAVLCFSVTVSLAEGVGCPLVNSIYPPSGSLSVVYRLNGTNILQLAAFRILQNGQQFGTDQPLEPTSEGELSLSLQFLLVSRTVRPAAGPVTVVLVPNDRSLCVLQQVWIDFRPYDPSAALIVPSAGRPSTLVRIGVGSYPPQDGDNSKDFRIEFGGVEAPFVSKGDRILVVRAPSGDTSEPVLIEVVSQYGNRFPLGQWTHLPEGRVSSVSPTKGQSGTRVNIHGEHLLGQHDLEEPSVTFSLAEVWLGGTLAQVVFSSDSEVVVVAGSGSSAVGDVQIHTTQIISDHVSVYSGEGPSLVLRSAWTQLVDGEIADVIPPFAQVGSQVFLCGSRLLGGGSTVSGVSFGDSPSSNFSSTPTRSPWASNTTSECVMASVPEALTAEATEVSVISDTMAVVKTRSGVLLRTAAITSLSPPSGQYGTVVNITGTHISLGSDDTPIVAMSGTAAAIIAMDTSSNRSWITVAAGWPDNATILTSGLVEVTVSLFGEPFSLSSAPHTWTYLPEGTILSVDPPFGQAGTVVTVTGENLLGYGGTLESVFIGDVKADILNSSNEEVVVRVPSVSGRGQVGMTLMADSGAVVEADGAFELREPGLITAVTPSSGQWGTKVVISGSHLFAHAGNITQVSFSGVLATIDHASSSSSSIHVRVGPCHYGEAVLGKVVITSVSGAVVTSAVAVWTYTAPGQVERVLPSEGEKGTIVTIVGRGLLGGGSGLSLVYLNRVLAEVLSASDSVVVVRNGELASADSSQPDKVRLEATSGAIIEGGYFVQREHGVITGFSPTSGQGGTYITVMGLSIANGSVGFYNASVAGVTVEGRFIQAINDSAVVVRVGGAPRGTRGGVTLMRDDGVTVTSRTPYEFVYSDPGEIVGLSPPVGVEGDVIHILGQYLVPKGGSVARVSLAGSTVSRVVEATAEEIVVIAGASSHNGSGKVMVEASDGSVSEGGSFTYLHNYSLAVVQGPPVGQFGTQLTLQLPFAPSALVRAYVGSTPAQVLFTDTSNWTIGIAVPRPPQPHPYLADIFVRDARGRVARLSKGFQYLTEGHILSVLPSTGQRGTLVVIRGLRLLGGGASVERVCLGGVQAILEHANDSEVTVRAEGSDTALIGDVEVVSDTGARVVLPDSWEYVSPASVHSVTPLTGQFGTRAMIQGVGLLAGGREARIVMLNGVEVHSVESSEDTGIVVRVGSPSLLPSPLPDEELVAVLVVSDTGSTVMSHNSSFTFNYTSPGVVWSVTPTNGTGGTEVTIEGVRLLGGGTAVVEVLLAGVPVLSVLNVSNHSITVVAGFTQSGEELKGGSVVVESDTGALVVLDSGWSYIAECPPGQFQNSSSKSCDHCSPLCTRCNGPENTDCFECSSGSFWTRDPYSQLLTCVAACPMFSTVEHECISKCQTNQYGQSFAADVFCKDCDPQCDPGYGCNGPTASECVRCTNVSYRGVCVDGCPMGHYLDHTSKSCLPCHVQCNTAYNCSGPSPTDCHTCKHFTVENSSNTAPPTRYCTEECPTGYYQHQLQCLTCHSYCSEGCMGPSPSQCNRCAVAALRYSNGSTLCVPGCDAALHYQDLEGVCQPCHHLCSALHGCNGPTAGDCWKCAAHSSLLDGVCITECPSGYYNSSGLCLACDSSCNHGCSGQGSKNCFSFGVAPFESGGGAIAFVVIVVLGLTAVVVVLSVLLVCLYCKQRGRYSMRKDVGRIFRPVTRTLSSRSSIKRNESIRVALSRRSSMLRREIFLGPGDPEFINPLVLGDVLEHPDDRTREQFRVAIGPAGEGTADLFSLGSDEGSEGNPYQEIPMFELRGASADPERITVGSQNDSVGETGDGSSLSAVPQTAEGDDSFTVKISFESPGVERGVGCTSPEEPKEEGVAGEASLVQETPYYNLDDTVLKADMAGAGLREHYDQPRKVKRRTLSSSFIGTGHYDTPNATRRVSTGMPPLLDGTKPTFAASHPYATPSRPMRRKSVSGATIHHVQKTVPLPRPRTPSPSDHVYATVKKLGRSDSGAHYDTPNMVAASLPTNHAPRKESGEASSGIKKLLALGRWVKGEPRPYEVPTVIPPPPHGGSSGSSAPLPPIPVPASAPPQPGQDDSRCDTPSTPLSERIYEEAFCGFDDSFVMLSTFSSTPPALPERRLPKSTTTQPASKPLTEDVEIIWTPPPAEVHSDSDDGTDVELPSPEQ